MIHQLQSKMTYELIKSKKKEMIKSNWLKSFDYDKDVTFFKG